LKDNKGLEILLPYQPKDCWFVLLYEPRLVNLNIKLKIKHIHEGMFIFVYSLPIFNDDPHIAYFDKNRHTISGECEFLMPFFKIPPTVL